jgi:hypothetical protein
MPTPRLFSREPDVIWVAHLHAFVHTRLQLGVDRATVEEELASALAAGEVADDEPAIAGFCAEYFDISASVFRVALDPRGRWQRVEG